MLNPEFINCSSSLLRRLFLSFTYDLPFEIDITIFIHQGSLIKFNNFNFGSTFKQSKNDITPEKALFTQLNTLQTFIQLRKNLNPRISQSRHRIEYHKKISQSPLNDYRSKSFPSLNESILEIIDTYESKNTGKDDNLVKQAAKEVRNCFDDGVYVPSQVCNRSINLENKKNYQEAKMQGVNIQILNIKEIEQTQIPTLSKLTFCPTYVITGQIFRKILRPERYRYLTGQYGAGKTYSFILYTLLSEMIFRFRHKHCQGKDDLPEGINFKIPKAFYINVNLDEADSKIQKKDQNKQRERIQNVLRWHCYQFKQLNEGQDVISLSYNLNEKYRRKYKVSLVLLNNQIDGLAAAYRQFNFTKKCLNQLYKKIDNLRKQQQKSVLEKAKKIQDIEQQIYNASRDYQLAGINLTKARKFIGVLNQMIGLRIFGSLFYLSSADIQQNILQNLKLMGDSNQNNIGSLKDRLDYPSTLYGNIAIADTCDLIAYSLKQYWQKLWHQNKIHAIEKIPKKQQEVLQIIKKKLNVVMRKQLFMLILPLKISQFMRNQLDKQSTFYGNEKTINLSELAYDKIINYSQNQMETKMISLITKIQSLSLHPIATQFTEFLDKATGVQHIDEAKPRLCFQLSNLTYHLLKNHDINYQIQDETTNIIKANQISGFRGPQSIIILGYDNFFQYLNNNSAIFHQLFRYQNEYVVTQINPLIVRKVLQIKRHGYYKYLLASKNPLFKYLTGNSSMLASFLQSSIITMLGFGEIYFHFNKIVKNKMHRTIIGYQKGTYRIVSCFKSIPNENMKDYSNFQFLDFFQKHCQTIADQNPEPQHKIRLTHRQSKSYEQKYGRGKALQFFKEPETPIKWRLHLLFEKLYYPEASQIIQSGIEYNRFDRFSKLIDFAFCTIDRHSYSVIIQAFDVTASKSQFKNKIQDFLVKFLNFKDKEKAYIKIDNKDYEVKLYYNLITTERFDNNYKKHFSKRIKSLQSQKSLTGQEEQKLKALKQFTFKNKDWQCLVKSVSKKFFLKSLKVISLVQDQVEITSNDPDKVIELDLKMFERVLEQLKKVDSID